MCSFCMVMYLLNSRSDTDCSTENRTIHTAKLNRVAFPHIIHVIYIMKVSRGSSVGIATRFGLDGPGVESQCGRDFPQLSRPSRGKAAGA